MIQTSKKKEEKKVSRKFSSSYFDSNCQIYYVNLDTKKGKEKNREEEKNT